MCVLKDRTHLAYPTSARGRREDCLVSENRFCVQGDDPHAPVQYSPGGIFGAVMFR